MDTIPIYPPKVIQHIEAFQKSKLSKAFGLDFERDIDKIFPNREFFLNHIESELESEFQDGNDDMKYELEAKLKNNALEEVINHSKYEFREYKTLLNSSELQFRKSVLDEEYIKLIPYSATLYSKELIAEVIPFTELPKPVVFFHDGLFSANLLYSKLFIHLIHDTKNDDECEGYTTFSVKDDKETLKSLELKAIYMYNFYISKISDECPDYPLKIPFEYNILAIFLESILYFIYAHEVGHVILKHNLFEANIEKNKLWEEEYEADKFAMKHLQKFCEVSGKNILTLLGPIVFFRFQIILERLVPDLGLDETHPPSTIRLKNYIAWLESRIHLNDKEILNSMLQFENQVSSTIDAIFDKIDNVSKKNNKPNTL